MADQPQPDRTKFLGGSDIAAVLNISPWKSAVQLWEDKIKPPVGDGGKRGRKAKQRGKRWEATVAEMLVEELVARGHKVQIVNSNVRYQDKAIGFFACEIDFEILLDDETEITNVELKTVHPFVSFQWGETDTDTVPVWYLAQAHWGLGITGRKRCIVAPLFGADEIRCYFVERDDETITALRDKGAKFWVDHVQTKVPPPAARTEDWDVLFPKESKAEPLPADDGLTAKILRLRAIDKEMKAREAERDVLEFEIKGAMKDYPEATVNGKTAVTWKERPFSYLDQAALKEDHPAIHRDYTVRKKVRAFNLRAFSLKGDGNDE